MASPRLRELAPTARGSKDAGSRNLAFTFYPSSVQDLSQSNLEELVHSLTYLQNVTITQYDANETSRTTLRCNLYV